MAITDLTRLLQEMSPVLLNESLVMVTTTSEQASQLMPNAYAMVKEEEGITLVLSADVAITHGFNASSLFKLISLRVESDLHAVGLTAAFATALGQAGIPANVLAGYYHDHILVPVTMAEHAMVELNNLSRTAQ